MLSLMSLGLDQIQSDHVKNIPPPDELNSPQELFSLNQAFYQSIATSFTISYPKPRSALHWTYNPAYYH